MTSFMQKDVQRLPDKGILPSNDRRSPSFCASPEIIQELVADRDDGVFVSCICLTPAILKLQLKRAGPLNRKQDLPHLFERTRLFDKLVDLLERWMCWGRVLDDDSICLRQLGNGWRRSK